MSKRVLQSILAGAVGLLCVLPGCEVLTFRMTDFPNAETGENGEIYVYDDLREIAEDPELTEDQKRQAFHDLGIQDEDLIQALLTQTS